VRVGDTEVSVRDTGETTRPDVSVIVAVYNTMPYLTECLTSLVEQSIGRDRLEVIAVDDGSDDGSEKELDRFAALHPETVRVLHQANSGGPAAPSNRGLELATGRYVFFIGSDDYLGPEALERMVRVADERGSDVVAGKMVGVNGRGVHEELFDRPVREVSLYDSTLPWAVSNTKLFRRELIERHGLRYPEDLPVGSDQPFTLEALIRAERITVLGDYDYYFAVRRESDGNITYRSGHETRLDCTARIMDFVAGLLEAGPRRDAVLRRHFAAELWKLLQPDLLERDEEAQRRVCEGVARLADTYLTETISDGLVVKRRARLAVARSRNLAALRASIAFQGAPPFVLDKGRAYAAYPGFRAADPEVPDRCFEVLNEGVTGRVVDCVGTASAASRPDAVELSARVALIGAGAGEAAPVRVGAVRLERGAPQPGPPGLGRRAAHPRRSG
jgi:poly(ribitol-phosphate) beta-N-acetylglucosaminyltransferase